MITRSLSTKVLNQRASSPSSSRLRTWSRRVRSPSPSAMSRSSVAVWPRGFAIERPRTTLRTSASPIAPATAITTHHSIAPALEHLRELGRVDLDLLLRLGRRHAHEHQRALGDERLLHVTVRL